MQGKPSQLQEQLDIWLNEGKISYKYGDHESAGQSHRVSRASCRCADLNLIHSKNLHKLPEVLPSALV